MIAEPYPVLWTGQRAVVVLPGLIDLSNSSEIRSELLSVINRGATTLIADMSATFFCDHSGADAVARAYQRAVVSGTDLRLVVTSQVVRRVISIGGIDRLVSVYPSLEAALAAGTPAAPALMPANGSARAGGKGGQAGSREPASPGAGGATGGPAEPDAGLGTEIALLDHRGVIVSVNHAWQAFAAGNQGEPSRVGPGISYLEVCAAAGDDPVATDVAAAIRRALTGDLPGPLSIEVPCHSPDTARWFDMLVSARPDDDTGHLGATVTLSLAKSEPRGTLVASADHEGDSPQLIARLAEDRDRIAAGLNDLLVHRLFSAGLSLQTALGILGDHPATGTIWDAVGDLDLAIRDLRSILFDRCAPGGYSG